MLFRLDESILAFANRSKNDERVARIALENILGCYREGNHIVVCAPAVCDVLRKRLFPKSTTQSWLLRGLSEEWATLSAHLGKISTSVEILGNIESPQISNVGAYKNSQIPIRMFSKGGLTQPTTVLTENLDDADFLLMMAKVYAVHNGLSSILKTNKIGGGGSTTAQQLIDIQNNQSQFCLCLVDSDKKSPSGGIGDTAKTVSKIYDPANPFVSLAVTPCHELENTIPELLLRVVCGSATVATSLAQIAALKIHGVHGSFEYLDLKNGATLQEIIALGQGSPDSMFWKASLTQALQHGAEALAISGNCVTNWACQNTSSCSCIVLHPLGDKLLRNSNVYFEGKTASRIAGIIDSHCKPLWTQLGKTVFEYCCGWREKNA